MVDSKEDPDIAKLATAAKWLLDTDCVLIGAGAGMSIESGFNTANPRHFAERWPSMAKKGFKSHYDCIGMDFETKPSESWGYYAQHMDLMRFQLEPNSGYSQLLEICKDKDYFVLSSNVDGLFSKAGFAEDRIYTPQGDYKFLQCHKPCRKEVWESLPVIQEVMKHIDSETQEINNEEFVPRCKWGCGRVAYFNARAGANFTHSAFDSAQERFIKWVESCHGKELVVIEIGAGFVTPTVVRYPTESIVREHENAKLIRINPEVPHVPSDIHAIGLKTTAVSGIKKIKTQLDKFENCAETCWNDVEVQESEHVLPQIRKLNWRKMMAMLKD